MAMGRRTSFDPRSDIYALGATLYELLTLRPVFDGKDRRELLRQITQDEPTPPRRIDPAIPRDLETIVMKAMAKEPERRYATAREMADDLRRFLDDRPIHARPPVAVGAREPLGPSPSCRPDGRRERRPGGAGDRLGDGLGGTSRSRPRRRKTRCKSSRHSAKGPGSSARGSDSSRSPTTLTMKGMERFASTSGAGSDPATQQFYQWALDFYERLTRERSIDPRTQALAFRRLGFTRMVSSERPPGGRRLPAIDRDL